MTPNYPDVDSALVATAKAITGSEVYLEYAPVGTAPPYCTYNNDIGSTPKLHGDGAVVRWERQVQVDYWCTVEQDDPVVARSIREGFNHARFTVGPGTGMCVVRVSSVNRIPEPQGDNLVHRVFTLEVDHGADAA
jgi:hypothetical protein